jgi:dipeptidyl aminopeptidase/acylaminoacyl peptidase
MSRPLRARFRPQDHFELRVPSDPQISSDGRFVAYVRTRADAIADEWINELCVADRLTGQRHELGSGSQPRWAPESHSVAFVRMQGGQHVIERWNAESSERQALTTLAHAPNGLTWSPDGRSLAFVMRVPAPATVAPGPTPDWESLRTPQWAAPGVYTEQLVRRAEGLPQDLPAGQHHIFVLDVASGAVRQLTNGPHDHGGPRTWITKLALAGHISWAPDGRHLIMSMPSNAAQDGPHDPVAVLQSDVYEFDLSDGAVRQLTHFEGVACQATVSPDGQWIAFVGFRNERKSFHTNVVHVMPRAGGPVRALPHPEHMEVHQPFQWLPDSTGLLLLQPQAGNGCLVRLDLDGKWTTLTRDVGGSAGSGYCLYQKGLSVARDGTVAYLRGSVSRTDEVALLLPDGQSGKVLTEESAWIEEREVAPIETLWLPTRRAGSSTPAWQAWLVRPAGVPADQPVPLILWLHGGPFLAWCPHLAILPQIWAARGYAVLMVNPRGSLGYGEAFTEELQHDFPGLGDLELLDMVEDVVARGGIDPQRVHVAGESGGGLMTAWLISHSTRFASAAAIYGVMDWTSTVLTQDRPDYYGYYWLPAPPWEAGMAEHYRRRSPLALVHQVRTPTLLLCGECDWRTPISQSEMYFTALKLCGVPAALVRYPDNNHSLEWHPSHWLDLIEQVDRWFRRH